MTFRNLFLAFDDTETAYSVARRAAPALSPGDTLCVRDEVYRVGPKGSVARAVNPIYVVSAEKRDTEVVPASLVPPSDTEAPRALEPHFSEPGVYGEPGVFPSAPNLPGFTTADLVVEVPDVTKVRVSDVVVGEVSNWQVGEVREAPLETIPLQTPVDLAVEAPPESTLRLKDVTAGSGKTRKLIAETMGEVFSETPKVVLVDDAGQDVKPLTAEDLRAAVPMPRVSANKVCLKPGDVIRDKDPRRPKDITVVEVTEDSVKTHLGRVIAKARLSQYSLVSAAS